MFASGPVEALAAALPPDGTNPVGVAARNTLVTHIKASTPGHWSGMFRDGPAFRDVFFPGLTRDGKESDISRIVGLPEDLFRAMSVAALCEQMWARTSELRPQLLISDVRAHLGEWNRQIRTRTTDWYTFCVGAVDGEVRTALAAFSDDARRSAARGEYAAGLASDAWVNQKLTQLASGSWTNATWELYHHWVKLAALGTPASEIDATIVAMRSKGLPVPTEVGPGTWRSWSGWYADIGGNDLPEAVSAILQSKTEFYPGCRVASRMPEAASFEFTANGQPGTGYRRAPSGSCFTADSLVVMADNSLRPIASVRAGESVAGTSGARTVLLNSRPPRDGRVLHRFGGTAFAFTATHPFIVHADAAGAGYASVDPESLARAVPTLTQFGVRALADGSPLVAHAPGGPAEVRAFVPPAVDTIDVSDEHLHDLIVDPDEEGRSEYFVGDGEVQVLVSSEIPRYAAAPETAAVVLHTLQQTAESLLTALGGVSDEGFADLLSIGLDSSAQTLLPLVAAQPPHRVAPMLLASEPADLTATVSQFTASLGSESGYDHRAGALVEQFVPRFASQFQAAIRLGWRSFRLADAPARVESLAVTVHCVELFGGADPSSDAVGRDATGLDAADTDVVVTLQAGSRSQSFTLAVDPAVSTDHSYFTCGQVAYLPVGPGEGDGQDEAAAGPRTLTIMIGRRSSGAMFPAVAEVVLPPDTTGYQVLCRPLQHDGAVLGQVRLDVRTLDAEGVREEFDRRTAWSPSDEPAAAAHLAAQASALLPEVFAGALLAFRPMAVTEEGQGSIDALKTHAVAIATSNTGTWTLPHPPS